MAIDEARTPVIAAVAQWTERDELVTNLDLLERVGAAAIAQAGALADRIERVTMVGALVSPAGSRPASEVADRLRLKPARCETTTTGGNTPQWLVTRAAEEIARGDLRATLIGGAEAGRSHRARSKGAAGAGSGGSDGSGGSPFNADRGARNEPDADPVVGLGEEGYLSRAEVGAGFIMPTTVYPAFESARAAAAGRTFAEQRSFVAQLMARFTEVASRNPYAWFRDAAAAAELANPSSDNRVICEPYTKRMNAFPYVDQATAIVVCSLALAREAGLGDDAVFILSGADAAEVLLPTARPDLARSAGIAAAGTRALEAAGISIDDVGAFDLYSCFPVAVEMGADALGVAFDDPRGLTVTGGLPYFGGPGNNYASHGIASMVDRLRATGGVGLCTGLGGYVTKHGVGVYSSTPASEGFRRGDTASDQEAIDASALTIALDADGPATVEANTIGYDGEGNVNAAPVIARLDDGRRVSARADDSLLGPSLASELLVGRRVHVTGTPATWTF